VSDLFDDSALARLERNIDEWLANLRGTNTAIVAIDRAEGDEIRWYVRMRGEEKEFTTIWITLGQRTLRYETYVMPAPEENATELPLALVCEPELDRIVGTLYDIVERAFPSLIRIGFASRFTDDE
jgi:hypothetical protein